MLVCTMLWECFWKVAVESARLESSKTNIWALLVVTAPKFRVGVVYMHATRNKQGCLEDKIMKASVGLIKGSVIVCLSLLAYLYSHFVLVVAAKRV